MAEKNVCMWCGLGKGKCFCMGKILWTGIVSLALGIGLWINWLNLNQTVALVLMLIGIKKVIQGLMYKKT